MPNTYTQIHIQYVFAVKYRTRLIQKEWKNELYKYITGIIQNQNHKLLAINRMADHIHILIGLRPNQSISDLAKSIKQSSSLWINEQKLSKGKFAWQEGYGAFSYARSNIDKVVKYIENQEEHHRKKSFLEEYTDFLKAFKIEYEEKYLFKPLE